MLNLISNKRYYSGGSPTSSKNGVPSDGFKKWLQEGYYSGDQLLKLPMFYFLLKWGNMGYSQARNGAS